MARKSPSNLLLWRYMTESCSLLIAALWKWFCSSLHPLLGAGGCVAESWNCLQVGVLPTGLGLSGTGPSAPLVPPIQTDPLGETQPPHAEFWGEWSETVRELCRISQGCSWGEGGWGKASAMGWPRPSTGKRGGKAALFGPLVKSLFPKRHLKRVVVMLSHYQSFACTITTRKKIKNQYGNQWRAPCSRSLPRSLSLVDTQGVECY